MQSESVAIGITPLVAVLNGEDPVDCILRLTEAEYRRFYIRVPDGFRCSFKQPLALAAHRTLDGIAPLASLGETSADPAYLQLDQSHIQALVERQAFTVGSFTSGALFLRLRSDQRPSIEYAYRVIQSGTLVPKGKAFADGTPTATVSLPVGCTVVKVLKSNSNMHFYFLQVIGFDNIFVERTALDILLQEPGDPEVLAALVEGDKLSDPYGLEQSTILVFSILAKAFEHRGKQRKEIDTPSIAAEFRRLNAAYEKNPKPFNDGRHEFAARLANPRYRYSAQRSREDGPPPVTIEVPDEPFFQQEFINTDLAKVLYAACCWSGVQEPRLEYDQKKLVDLLVGLGFCDADATDQVQSVIFFIAGERLTRDENIIPYTHTRRERA